MNHRNLPGVGTSGPSSTANASSAWRRSVVQRLERAVGAVAMCIVLVASRLHAQEAPMAGPQRATRAELTALAAQLDQRLASNDKKIDRARTQSELSAVRRRLEEGDFRVGDQFVVTIRTDVVRADTASVRDSLLVAIANLPDVSLRGVLRAELNDRMSAHVARFLRDATVRTNVLTRVQIVGAVGRPGFYLASPDRPISDLLMIAGGPAVDAKLDELEVNRSGRKILSAKDSKRAIKDGRTIEQIDMQSGDEVVVPQKRRINWQAILSVIGVATTLFFAVVQFLRLYYDSRD